MSASLTARNISKALFDTDPMNTCCKENDCFDEYDRVAESVAAKLAESYSLEQALTMEISEWFFDGGSFESSRLDPVLELLKEA